MHVDLSPSRFLDDARYTRMVYHLSSTLKFRQNLFIWCSVGCKILFGDALRSTHDLKINFQNMKLLSINCPKYFQQTPCLTVLMVIRTVQTVCLGVEIYLWRYSHCHAINLQWKHFGQFLKYKKFLRHHFSRKFNFDSILLEAVFCKIDGSRIKIENLQSEARSPSYGARGGPSRVGLI